MKLVLFEVFGVSVYSYGLLIAIGVIAAAYIFIKNGKELGYDEDSLFNLIIIAVISGVLGGKILFIITEFKNIVEDPSMLLSFGEGFVIYGAMIAGGISIYAYSRWKKWKVLDLLDSVVPGLALAQGFGRIGCFLAGCCYGRETDSFLGVVFPHDSLAPGGVPLLPTQIFSSIFDFILAGILMYYSRKNKGTGKVFSMYVIIYSIGRFFVEFLRNDPRGNVGALSTSQFIAIFTLGLGLFVYFRIRQKERKNQGEEI